MELIVGWHVVRGSLEKLVCTRLPVCEEVQLFSCLGIATLFEYFGCKQPVCLWLLAQVSSKHLFLACLNLLAT